MGPNGVNGIKHDDAGDIDYSEIEAKSVQHAYLLLCAAITEGFSLTVSAGTKSNTKKDSTTY